MRSIMRKTIFVVILCFLLLCSILLWICLSLYPFQYETTDLANYGSYIGNVNNKTPDELISSFFPEEVAPILQM